MDHEKEGLEKKRVRFALANTPTQDRIRTIKRKYRRQRLAQTGRGLVRDLAKLGTRMVQKQ